MLPVRVSSDVVEALGDPPTHGYRLRCLRAWSQPQSRLHQGFSVRCIEEQCTGVKSVTTITKQDRQWESRFDSSARKRFVSCSTE